MHWKICQRGLIQPVLRSIRSDDPRLYLRLGLMPRFPFTADFCPIPDAFLIFYPVNQMAGLTSPPDSSKANRISFKSTVASLCLSPGTLSACRRSVSEVAENGGSLQCVLRSVCGSRKSAPSRRSFQNAIDEITVETSYPDLQVVCTIISVRRKALCWLVSNRSPVPLARSLLPRDSPSPGVALSCLHSSQKQRNPLPSPAHRIQ